MPEFNNPSEIARETLRLLAVRRIPPTPDNYLALYNEIAGAEPSEPFPAKALKDLVGALPRANQEQLRFARRLESGVAEANWDGIKTAVADLVDAACAAPLNWSALLRDILIQLETRHRAVTQAKKREALEHVLTASASADILYTRLQSLLRTWLSGSAGGAEPAAAEAEAPEAATEETTAEAPGSPELRELIAKLLEDSIAILLEGSPDLVTEAAELAERVRGAQTAADLTRAITRLRKFSYRLHFVAEDQAELKGALLHLLQLIVDNISELVVDDQWLHSQIEVVRKQFDQPLNLRRLDDVERRLKEVIYKQSNLKHQLDEAKDRLKSLLVNFVDRLNDIAVSTGDYHGKLEGCVSKIGKARDIAELTDVLDQVMKDTRVLQVHAQQARDELVSMRTRVDEAEKEVTRLQNELAQAGEMARHDPLTGALNRKGMDEAVTREVSRSRRRGSPLCVAMLDVDNFKRINDVHGHQAGDGALVHLASVVRESLRPQDTLARYGGEEFFILLPDTVLEDAAGVMTRLQRQLTKRFFLHKNEKLLITFSAGVAELGPEENAADGLKRADQAMYAAKRAGKNRVVAA